MGPHGYFRATRHPWSGLLFVLPLLAIYETGLLALTRGAANGNDSLRTGADTWLRWALANLGLAGLLWTPVLLVGLLFFWALCRRNDRPATGFLTLLGGMTVESLLFAAGLWALSQSFFPLLESVGLRVATASPAGPAAPAAPTLEHFIGYVGAGIYEEALFRLFLLSGLIWLLRLLEFPALWAMLLAAAASALAFAAAHNLGPHGEPFNEHIFLFRTVAGLYFAVLFHMRGFGVAVGAHTGYDMFVGILT